VGWSTQKKLKDAGFIKWEDIVSRPHSIPLGQISRDRLLIETRESLDALDAGNIGYFTRRFSPSEQWRILSAYFPRASFLDIETTGLSFYEARITTAVCYHRGKMYAFVRNENLGDLLSLLDEVDLLISFNGKSFDINFILDEFHIPVLPCPHIDLRWVCYHAGLRKGLKEIEKRCGIRRSAEVQKIDGYEAVMLWNDWITRKRVASRERLVKYCTADVAALLHVAREVLVRKNVFIDVPVVSQFLP
jgi:uncharacterized protein YprB with RNaseH-like and TPR domain